MIKRLLKIRSKINTKIKKVLGLGARPSTLFLKSYFKGEPVVGVEIGVFKGENARNLIDNLNVEKIYLIDSYERLYIKSEEVAPSIIMEEESEYSVFIEKDHNFDGIIYNFERCHDIAKGNLKKFSDRTSFIKKRSSDAVNDVSNNIDFIYVDGNHNYEYVKQDIELYFPKLKKGGVMAGHDFSAGYLGVARAVLEYSDANGLKIEGCSYDWWIVKS